LCLNRESFENLPINHQQQTQAFFHSFNPL
jgi:hypothetical protein